MDLKRRAPELILEHMDVAAILLAANGNVLYANPAAERMLGSGRGLSISKGRLKAVDAERQGEIDIIVARAKSPKIEGRADLVRIRDACGSELFLRAIPVPSVEARSDLRAGGVVVLIYDCISYQDHTAGQLRKQYGLTDTEIRLVCHLIEGCSLRDAAINMRVAYETARSYLKSVFRKTDTHRQVELLQKVAREEMARVYAQGVGNAG